MLDKITKKLGKSPINYFSDLFIVCMVMAWIVVIIFMLIFGIYSTVVYSDNSIWSDLGVLVGIPLSCGGAIWMIKNSVQHKIAAQRGEKCEEDFPAVDDGIEISGLEKPLSMDTFEDIFAKDEEATEEE